MIRNMYYFCTFKGDLAVRYSQTKNRLAVQNLATLFTERPNRGQVRPPLEGGCQSCDTPIHVTQSPPQNL